MKDKKGLSTKFWITVLLLCSLFVILIAFGFATYSNYKRPVIENKENGGDVVLNYASDSNEFQLKDLTPVLDSVGIKNNKDGEYYDFSVDVSLDNATSIKYEISILKDEEYSTISDEDIRIYLEKEDSGEYVSVFEPASYTPLTRKTKVGTPVGNMILYEGRTTRSQTERFRLRIWSSDKSALSKGNYGVSVYVNASA